MSSDFDEFTNFDAPKMRYDSSAPRKRPSLDLKNSPLWSDTTLEVLFKQGALKLPIVTLGMCFFLFFAYLFQTPDAPIRSDMRIELQRSGYFNNIAFVFYEFCYTGVRKSVHICENNKKAYRTLIQKLSSGQTMTYDELKDAQSAYNDIYLFIKNFPKYEPTVPSIRRMPASAKALEAAVEHVRKRHSILSRESIGLKALFKAENSHASGFRLLINLLGLLFFGSIIECWLGKTSYLLLYFVGGLFGLLSYTWIFAGSGLEIEGASVNIAALVGAYLVFYYNNLVAKRLEDSLKPKIFYELAGVVLLFLVPIVIGHYSTNFSGHLTISAHILGLLFGAGLATLMTQTQKFSPASLKMAQSAPKPAPATVPVGIS